MSELGRTPYVLDIAVPDGSVGMHMEEIARDDAVTLRSTFYEPVGSNTDTNVSNLMRVYSPSSNSETPEGEAIFLGHPTGAIARFIELLRHHNVIAALGYNVERSVSSEDGLRVTSHEFTHPASGEQLNTAAGALFETLPLTFTDSEGGLYTSEAFVSTLSLLRKVHVATEQPYQLHDHAVSHTLGWLAFGDDVIEPFTEAIATSMEAAEQTHSHYKYPQLKLASEHMNRLDQLSADIGYTILFDKNLRTETARIEKLISMLKPYWAFGPLNRRYGMSILKDEKWQRFFDRAAETMVARYQAADDAATKLAA